MLCPKCEYNNSDENKFCENCGIPIDKKDELVKNNKINTKDETKSDDNNVLKEKKYNKNQLTTKLCPYCGEKIKSIAKRCKHCKSNLNLSLEKILLIILITILFAVIIFLITDNSFNKNRTEKNIPDLFFEKQIKNTTSKDEITTNLTVKHNAKNESYNKATSINSNDDNVYYNRGRNKIKLKDYQGAIEDYNKAISINPNNDSAYYSRGIAKANLKDYQGAIEDYDKAININPSDDNAYYNRGVNKHRLRNYQGAIEDYDKAININPNNDSAYSNRGLVKADLRDYQGAIKDYDKAISINPNNDGAYNKRGSAKVKLKDYQGAIEDYDKAININPDDNWAYYNKDIAKTHLKIQKRGY